VLVVIWFWQRLYTGCNTRILETYTGEQFRGCVQEAFATITPEMVTNSELSLLRLARLCLQMNGGHFEHFL
jgi:hypothetical protein